MKTQIFQLVLILLFLNSCDKNDGGNYAYKSWSMEIENSSGHQIRIQCYSNLLPVLNTDTTLSINQRYILSTGDEDPLSSGPDLISRSVFDSAVIIFDGGKKLVYTHNKLLGFMNDSANNILWKENYFFISKSGNHEVFRYVIDESDYQRAVK